VICVVVDGKPITIEKDLVSFEVVEEEIRGEDVIPHVIEPSFGIDRIIYTVLDHSYDQEEVAGESRVVLRFIPAMAPLQVAILPLMDRPELARPAEALLQAFRREGIMAEYDTSGSIGRRYRRNDEVGTPFCVTIDYETIEEATVTIRDRDSMGQVRVPLDKVVEAVSALVRGEVEFLDAGTPREST